MKKGRLNMEYIINIVDYAKLEESTKNREVKVSDIFLAAENPTKEVDWEEFIEAGWEKVDAAIKAGYVYSCEYYDEYCGEPIHTLALTKKGLELIRKHMK